MKTDIVPSPCPKGENGAHAFPVGDCVPVNAACLQCGTTPLASMGMNDDEVRAFLDAIDAEEGR